MIVLRTQVSEDERRGAGVEIVSNEGAGHFVRQVPVASHNALLDGPRVGTHFQHLQIVVRFEQQDVGAAQMKAHRIGHVAEIGGDRNLDSLGAKGEAYRVLSVMRNGEAGDVDIADRESGAGREQLQRRRVVLRPGDRRGG
jgi:hypothetical protein